MSSILTNNGAMVALQTLKGINSNLARTQNEISTGKSVANAKDNAAVWAISKTMEADVEGFKGISDALNQGESTVATARAAAESVTDLLKDIKTKIVGAQQATVSDRAKLQTDIAAYTKQIESVVKSAQFNGLNLIDGSNTAPVKILSSLDRSGGGVTASHIEVSRQDLSLTPTVAGTWGTATTAATVLGNGAGTFGDPVAVADGATNTISVASAGAGHGYRVNVGALPQFEYIANAGDSSEDVAAKLTEQMTRYFQANSITNMTVSRNGDDITFSNNSGAAVNVTVASATGGTPPSGGGLGALSGIDVTSDANAATALSAIETLLQTSINASSALGSAQKRIEIQNDFVGKLADMMKSGIGSLVDADMEETSARLQALQVQQQLATQSLSIANQAPQSLLSLFRG